MKYRSTAILAILLLMIASAARGRGRRDQSQASAGGLSIGLAVGQVAPQFSLSDQSGHVVSAATLKGVNGTVLLFFRSADW